MPFDAEYVFGPFRLRPAARQLLRDGQPVRLGTRAFDMLCVLVKHPAAVLSNDDILQRVWGTTVVDDGSVRVHVAAIRKALGDDAARQAYIGNVPLQGYRFTATVQCLNLAAEEPSVQQVEPPISPDSEAPGLIGRDEVMDALAALLPQRRLVTVVGPGGIGKTSVAAAVAARVAHRFEHGTCIVDLSSLTDPAFVPSALAAALGVRVLEEDALAGAIAQLEKRSMLVVLDNCEHLIDAAAGLAEVLLRRLPGLSLLATSREPLRAQGEWVHRLRALATPWDGLEVRSAQEAMAYPAIELLVERIRASVDDFSLGDADVSAAVRVCRAMDGIPLAIELAATHVPSFGLHHLATLLSDRMSLLTHGRRTALTRHQTLRATLDWSHELLDGQEQAVLRRLSVFRGGFGIQAGLAVARCTSMDEGMATDCLVGLVNKSMLCLDRVDGHGQASYRFLETTRAYAQQRLAESQELAMVFRRHAEVVRTLLEGQPADVQVHIDDVRCALDWACAEEGDLDLGVGLALASTALWFRLGLVREFRDRLDKAREGLWRIAPDEPRDLRLAWARGHAHLHTVGPTDVSDEALSSALTLALTAGGLPERLTSLGGLYSDRLMRGDCAAALNLARQFGELCGMADDERASATHHRMMAMALHMRAEHAQASVHAREALRAGMARLPSLQASAYQVDHQASAMVSMARILWIQGQADEAMAMADDAVLHASATGHGLSEIHVLALAACPIALWCGDIGAAQRHAQALSDAARRHALEFWRSWGAMYEEVVAWWPARGVEAPTWVARFASQAVHADILGTVAAELLDGHAVRRADAGRSPWCAAEIARAHLERQWRGGQADPAWVARSLAPVIEMARVQGARAWELRSTITLAECLHAQGRSAEAADHLEAVLLAVTQGASTHDPSRARALLADLRHG